MGPKYELQDFLKFYFLEQNLSNFELEKKYFGGVNSIGEPWFTKSQPEMEGEAKKEVEEFMTRNG